MSARLNARMARQALDIRQVQERVALERLRAQAAVEGAARARLRSRLDDHAAAQQGWGDFLNSTVLDPMTAILWRRHSDGALTAVHAQEAIVNHEASVRREQRDLWERHLRLADAAQSVARRAAGTLRRRSEEQALSTAEDLFQARKALR